MKNLKSILRNSNNELVSTIDLKFLFLFFLFFISHCKGNCGSGSEVVEVLVWSGGSWSGQFHGEYFPEPNYLGHAVNKTTWQCPVTCTFTSNKRRLGNVDALLFEAQPLTSYYDDYKIDPPQWPLKYGGQLWINTGYETQYYFHLYGDPGYLRYIDANMTFYLQSQIPITFTCLWGGFGLEDGINHFLKPPPPKSSKKCVVFMATNCGSAGATARTEYVQTLMQYIRVDSYGRCLNNAELPEGMRFPIYSNHGASMRNKIKIFSEYKFVLTFENNNVTDYVTEKLTNVFQAGSVPVYMGAPNVHPYWTPGENSLVQTKDFSGPRELASYLSRMCHDDSEYMKFFEWKKKGISDHFKQRFKDCAFYGGECRLCLYIAEQRKKLSETLKHQVDKRRRSDHIYQLLFLNGNDQWAAIDLQKENPLQLTNEFTISMWIKPESLSGPFIPILTYQRFYSLKLIKIWKRYYLQLCVLNYCYTGSQSIQSDLYHIGVVFQYHNDENDKVLFFSNGVQDEAISIPNEPLTKESYISEEYFPHTFLIGTDSKQKILYFGSLDTISIWSYAFSSQQMIHSVFTQYMGIEEGLISFWDMDHLDKRVLFDRSPNKLHATIVGNAEFKDSLTRPLITSNPCI